MPHVRTVMVTISPLLHDIIMQLVMSLDLVAVLETRDGAAETLKSLTPELVVFGLLPGEGTSLAADLHAAWPQADFLALAHDLRSAWLHTQDGQRKVLADLSPESLVGAMRCRSGRRAGI